MVNQDPNSVAELVARLGADGARVVDLRTEADPALEGEGGAVIVVATNAASGAQRLRALAGAPTDGVLLDELVARLHAGGLAVRAVHGTLEDPVAGAGDVCRRVPPEVVEWVRAQPGGLVRELVVVASPGEPGEVPALVPAVPESEVRLVDEFTERAERDLRERREVLTVRDHILGLEATAAAAEDRAAYRGRRVRELRGRVEELEAALEAVSGPQGPGGAPPSGTVVGRAARRLRGS